MFGSRFEGESPVSIYPNHLLDYKHNRTNTVTHINMYIYIYIRIYKSNVCSVKCPVTSCFAWALYYLWFDILDILGMITVHETGSLVPKQPVWRDVRGFWTLLIWWGHYIPQFQLHTIATVGISYITIWLGRLGHDILYPINGHTIPGGIYIYLYYIYIICTGDISFTETITNLALCNEGRHMMIAYNILMILYSDIVLLYMYILFILHDISQISIVILQSMIKVLMPGMAQLYLLIEWIQYISPTQYSLWSWYYIYKYTSYTGDINGIYLYIFIYTIPIICTIIYRLHTGYISLYTLLYHCIP